MTDDLTIVGADAATHGDRRRRIDRVFDVKAVTVSLQRLTITAAAPRTAPSARRCRMSSPGAQAIGQTGTPGEGGGGIRNAGTLSLTDCIVSLNQAGTGGAGGPATAPPGPRRAAGGRHGRGGEGGAGGHGGGILSTGGSLHLERTIVQDNVAGTGGVGGNGAGGNGGLDTGRPGRAGVEAAASARSEEPAETAAASRRPAGAAADRQHDRRQPRRRGRGDGRRGRCVRRNRARRVRHGRFGRPGELRPADQRRGCERGHGWWRIRGLRGRTRRSPTR